MDKRIVLSNAAAFKGFAYDFTVDLDIDPSKQYEIALEKSFIPYSWHNVSHHNNEFTYVVVPAIYKSFRIPCGLYTIPKLNQAIKEKIKENNDDPDNIEISLVNGRVLVRVYCGYGVVFSHHESVGYFLGFKRVTILDHAFGRKFPEPIVKINSSIGLLHTFRPVCSVFGMLMETAPPYAKYIPLTTKHLRLWITDESDKVIKLWRSVFHVFRISEKI